MDTEDLSPKSLENTLCVLYRAANDLDGRFKTQMEPVITYYRSLYLQVTGKEFANYDGPRGALTPSKPPILPKKEPERCQRG